MTTAYTAALLTVSLLFMACADNAGITLADDEAEAESSMTTSSTTTTTAPTTTSTTTTTTAPTTTSTTTTTTTAPTTTAPEIEGCGYESLNTQIFDVVDDALADLGRFTDAMPESGVITVELQTAYHNLSDQYLAVYLAQLTAENCSILLQGSNPGLAGELTRYAPDIEGFVSVIDEIITFCRYELAPLGMNC